jgi:hypothetical protein
LFLLCFFRVLKRDAVACSEGVGRAMRGVVEGIGGGEAIIEKGGLE